MTVLLCRPLIEKAPRCFGEALRLGPSVCNLLIAFASHVELICKHPKPVWADAA